MSGRPYQRLCDDARSHKTRRDCDTVAADERTNHRSATGGPSSLVCRNLQPFTSPQALDTLVVHLPACVSQQSCNTAITVPAILAGQFDHFRDQALFISKALWLPSLGRAILAQNTTCPTFRNLHRASDMINASKATRRAQKCPFAAYARINLSSVRSDTARLSRSFSFSRRFSSLSCSVPIPPYFFFQR